MGRLPPGPPPYGGYQRYPGGVYVPPGGAPWGYYPYHYLWWLGWPRPYGYSYGHASLLGAVVGVLLLIVVLGAAAMALGWLLRRGRRSARLD